MKESYFEPTPQTGAGGAPPERALLVQVVHGRQTKAEGVESLAELERLADTAGVVVIGAVTQRRDRPTPKFYVGEGKLEDIQMACRQGGANLVIFDNDLSPVQVNNIDLALGIKVIDRTELILQIFARRARSAEAQIQVELAQLEYLVSRIPVSARQQRFQGGIGMRGPGESPFRLRNAPMRRRIKDLKEKLEHIRSRRSTTRVKRPYPLVCLVGYTNAGKSTLLNALADADAYVDDRLFATLDTKTRLVHLAPQYNVLLIDTVGFIRHLPHGLVASFRSTLDVAREADLLLRVADASHPFVCDHIEISEQTLETIEARQVPYIRVFNKADLIADEKELDNLQKDWPDAMFVSARSGRGLAGLKDELCRRLIEQGAYAGRKVHPPAGFADGPWSKQ